MLIILLKNLKVLVSIFFDINSTFTIQHIQMRRIFYCLLPVLAAQFLTAQNENDALRYSYSRFGGTASSAALAGSTGAVGADFSNIVLNPAGLGMYKRNEFMFTPSFDFTNANATYYGNSRNDNKLNFNFSNLGLVIYTPSVNRMKTEGWLSSTFSIGLTRIAGLGGRFTSVGINNQSSLADAMVSAANGKSTAQLDPFFENLGYQAFLFDDVPGPSNDYANNNGPRFGGQQQRMVVDRKGAISEWNIAYAGNYSNKLFIGASAGIRRVVFEQNYTLQETDIADTIPNFRSLNYTSTYEDRGNGFSFRAGVIYRFTDAFRMGISGQIPVLINFKTTYSSSLETSFSNINTVKQTSPEGTYNFKLNTPARLALQGAYQVGKSAMISAEVERLNYGSAGFRTTDGFLENVNDRISENFKTAYNARIGIEKRFDEFYLRGGYAYFDNPYQSNLKLNASTQVFTLGAGYRDDEFFYDLGLVFANVKEEFNAYEQNLAPVQSAEIRNNRTNLIFSFGYRF